MTVVTRPADAATFLVLSDSATERPPGPARAERRGGDLVVLMSTASRPRPRAGRRGSRSKSREGGSSSSARRGCCGRSGRAAGNRSG